MTSVSFHRSRIFRPRLAGLDIKGVAADIWVYLDTNVIITLVEALSGDWRPPPPPISRSERQRLASARIFFYGYRDRWSRWYLVTSSEARRELIRSESTRWLDGLFLEVDRTADVFEDHVLAAECGRFRAAGAKEIDAAHLAQAAIRPWVGFFITDDDKLRKAAARAGLPEHLHVVSSIEAESAYGSSLSSCRSSPPTHRRRWPVSDGGFLARSTLEDFAVLNARRPPSFARWVDASAIDFVMAFVLAVIPGPIVRRVSATGAPSDGIGHQGGRPFQRAHMIAA